MEEYRHISQIWHCLTNVKFVVSIFNQSSFAVLVFQVCLAIVQQEVKKVILQVQNSSHSMLHTTIWYTLIYGPKTSIKGVEVCMNIKLKFDFLSSMLRNINSFSNINKKSDNSTMASLKLCLHEALYMPEVQRYISDSYFSVYVIFWAKVTQNISTILIAEHSSFVSSVSLETSSSPSTFVL